ncbi:RTC4-like domain-containing protein [Sordaria brevicollis]|uniref:Restriction of telomere capping protein 4 n=1 Tax=Sordaria brevicollis TaxID=83679 RepID=A0AAE0PDQ0_SORBR|nr:RTC4-like domain-containing protein [Sordaria brevicollis]
MVRKKWEAPTGKGRYGGSASYGKSKFSTRKHNAAQKQPTRTTSTKSPAQSQPPKTTEIPERPSPRFRIPALFEMPSDDQVSPTKKPMAKGRIRRAKPPRKHSQETGNMSSARDLDDDATSELSSVDFGFDTPRPFLCPMCDEEVDKSVFELFKAKHPRMTIQHQQKFCQTHKRASANKEWLDKGYPDIDWTKMDKRIRNHYDFLRTILNGGKSYYADVLSDKVKSGQNKTRLMSEVNLTPGYYGMRGLRLMSEHLVNGLASELRKRAVQDRLVAARGHMFYIQSVLVPELAVRLIMEDMNGEGSEKVTEEQARTIMNDSTWVGELLNEEVADHVLYEDEEDQENEESQHVEMELREEDEAHITYEHEIKSKEDGEAKPNYRDQNGTDQEEEGVKYIGNSVIHIDDSDKVKSEDQNGGRQEGKDIKSGGNGFNYMKDSDDGSSLSDHSDSEFEDI